MFRLPNTMLTFSTDILYFWHVCLHFRCTNIEIITVYIWYWSKAMKVRLTSVKATSYTLLPVWQCITPTRPLTHTRSHPCIEASVSISVLMYLIFLQSPLMPETWICICESPISPRKMESQERTNQRLNLCLQQNNGTVITLNLLRIKLSFEKDMNMKTQ
jgi:hypothetical protein